MAGLTRREVIKAADASARLLVIDGTLTLTQSAHAGRDLLLSATATLVTVTLPLALGAGTHYMFIVGVTNTSTYVIQAGVAADEMLGQLLAVDSDDDSNNGYPALDGDNFDTITIGDVTRGVQGSWFELTDIALNQWFVRGQVIQSGGSEATPFTSAV